MTYEGLFIIKSDLSKEDQDKTIKFITEEIVKQGGELKEAKEIEKKSLAYEIEKNKEGLFYLIYFEAPAEAMKSLNHVYKLNNMILRNLILNKGK